MRSQGGFKTADLNPDQLVLVQRSTTWGSTICSILDFLILQFPSNLNEIICGEKLLGKPAKPKLLKLWKLEKCCDEVEREWVKEWVSEWVNERVSERERKRECKSKTTIWNGFPHRLVIYHLVVAHPSTPVLQMSVEQFEIVLHG